MTSPPRELPHRTRPSANRRDPRQTHDINSPNDMVMDTDDYIGVPNEPEKVAIIDPDTLEHGEADQLQDLPMANDRAYPRLHPDNILCCSPRLAHHLTDHIVRDAALPSSTS
ncbi:hypothetical protein FZEAL_10412 [Fusarium zealandicum]|uniref:Uncharacterized protein n=1 Tax=Fusarium zealandicum TaxID=1053134 RepID=A0A8H4U2I2_9HYPO|nr:hypothetical protein FZEAL_10412 [Fusarium zealandicum]